MSAILTIYLKLVSSRVDAGTKIEHFRTNAEHGEKHDPFVIGNDRRDYVAGSFYQYDCDMGAYHAGCILNITAWRKRRRPLSKAFRLSRIPLKTG